MTEVLGAEAIIEKFGLKFKPDSDCVNNSIINVTRILLNHSQGQPPEIYYHKEERHAYIVYSGYSFNGGVTGEIGDYFDFSPEQLKDQALKRTDSYLFGVLRAFYADIPSDKDFRPYDRNYDICGIRRDMQEVFPEPTLVVALPKLQQLYIQLTQARP